MILSPQWLILILAAPVVLLVLMVVFFAIFGRLVRRRCPACLRKGLKQTSVVRAESVVDGQDVPVYRSYFRCQFCGTRFKLHDGILSGVAEDEMDEATRFG